MLYFHSINTCRCHTTGYTNHNWHRPPLGDHWEFNVVMENRAHLRVEIDRPVVLWLPDGSSRQVRAFNLSLGGMGVLSAAPFREGSVLGMSFKLEVSEEEYDMHIQGEVMYSHLKNDRHAMGLRFIYVDDEQRVWLTRFIDHRRALRGH